MRGVTLVAVAAVVFADDPSSAGDRRGRSLAIEGFTWALVSVPR
jgi:hypothetical protein